MEILPQPRKIEKFDENMIFDSEYAYKSLNDEYISVTKYISGFLKCSEKAEHKIIFKIDETLKKEEYILEADDDITIISSSAEGAFRAASTLKQLVRQKRIEKQKIHDYPMIKNRGIMLDISRGKVPEIKSLFKIIDIMADLKYNQLQLYLENIVFEYEHFPEYWKDMMPITKQELLEIKNYCNERFIELVPNQNGFGHMGKWLEKKELTNLGITRDDGENTTTLNPFKEESLQLVDTIYGDLLPYFDSEFVNVGMDEPFELGMGETREFCEKDGEGKVYLDYLNKILELANNKYKKTPMFWDDIVFNHPEYIKDVNPKSIVLDWGYEEEFPFMERCRILKEHGLKFYTCPGTSTWASFTGRFENMVYNIEAAAKACIVHGGEGFLLTDWGDGGHSQFIVMSFLPYIYGACCSWNYNVPRMLKDFTHTPYCKINRGILKYCIEYADEFLFEGNNVGALLREAANYYVLENNSLWNSTNIWGDSICILQGKDTWLDEFTCNQVRKYMQNIKEELLKLDKTTPYIDEIICNCDMVILFARFVAHKVCGVEDLQLKCELKALKEEFLRLWKKENREVGSEIFAGRIEKMIDLI